MIEFDHYTLDNGLSVILHHDPQRTVVSVNVLYKVGSRNDPPHRTGFAHLFEHLMFEGSENVANFDDALQLAGGENNAVTSSDYTLYYDTLPADNLETALWLESDRMRKLRFSEKSLATQKKVVIEEFKETCLEQPYGDLYHHLNGLIYRVAPYRWPVIGERFEHIEEASLEEVKDFYYRYYRPDNAILCIAGNYDPVAIRGQVERWFGDIPSSDPKLVRPELPREPEQEEFRSLTVSGDVPGPLIYLHLRTVARMHPDFPAIDILAFLLGGGRSSLLYRRLVRDTDLFTEVSAGINDNIDDGGIIIEARPADDVDLDEARQKIFAVLEEMIETGITREQLEKVVNQLEHRNHYRDINISSRASELVFYAMLGQPELANRELDDYLKVTVEDVNRVARSFLRREVMSELVYLEQE